MRGSPGTGIMPRAIPLEVRRSAPVRFANPSFEGRPPDPRDNNTWAVAPPQWRVCLERSTPDTQPGAYGVTVRPSDGGTYMGMVCRADGSTEAAAQTLPQPLRKGITYCFSADLAFDTDADPQDRPVLLRVWGTGSATGNGCRRDELLWTSPVVADSVWARHQICFTPKQEQAGLMLEAHYAPGRPAYFGYVLVDNLSPVEWVEPWGQTVCVDDSVWIDARPAGAGADWQVVWKANEVFARDLQANGRWISRAGTYPLEITDPVRNRTYRTGLTVERRECEGNFLVPNVFTPDGDGTNETFRIRGIEPDTWRLEIYDAWGRAVYRSAGYGGDWPGEPGRAGTYYYLLASPQGTRTYRGWVQVLRAP